MKQMSNIVKFTLKITKIFVNFREYILFCGIFYSYLPCLICGYYFSTGIQHMEQIKRNHVTAGQDSGMIHSKLKRSRIYKQTTDQEEGLC